MSHDIRTPMNAIVGLTEIAEKNIDDKVRVENCLGKISLASNHLLTLINDILDISQVESGKFTLNPVEFSLTDSAQDLVNIIYPQAQQKQLLCCIHLRNITHEYLTADKLRLNQIWLNILSNAVKYTSAGGRIDIYLEEFEVADENDRIGLIFTVKDTGCGMNEEFIQNIFEPFAREKDSRIDKIQG
ncbi:MAG: sensor histidine kinase [Ruminiclostridium sp.]